MDNSKEAQDRNGALVVRQDHGQYSEKKAGKWLQVSPSVKTENFEFRTVA